MTNSQIPQEIRDFAWEIKTQKTDNPYPKMV
jgi:hypothetical protein